MADVAEHTTYTDAATAISQGKRHLLVQDYTAAATALADGLEMMAQKLGDCDDALGEPYLLYGRALLGLAREEVGVLGEGVPGSEDADEDDECDEENEDEEDDKGSDNEAKDEEEKPTTNEDKEHAVDEAKSVSANKEDASKENEAKDKEAVAAASDKSNDKKIEDAKEADKDGTGETKVLPGTSKGSSKNGPEAAAKSSNCNGAAGTSSATADEEDDVNKEDDEEDPGRGIDLQVAWEVLELAKIVFTRRGEAGLKHLAEAHRLLGEVAMESDNPQGAIADLEGALGILEKIEPCEPRALADIHYQLGLAHSLANDFDASIKQFGEATSLLEARIKQLEETPETVANKSDDPFYSIEGEIKELRELLPAIQEKIIDMKDFKEEACRLVIEGIKNKVASGSCTNGSSTSASAEGPSGSGEDSQAKSPPNPKPASDISHLVRKKRKHEDDKEEQVQSPCKKPTP